MQAIFLFLLSPAFVIRTCVAQQPNVIFFMVDDLQFTSSWSVAAPDNRSLANQPTPVINKLMNESVVFTRAYSAAPKCAPSRFAVLTGRYPTRSEFARELTVDQGNGASTTKVSVPYSKIYYDDEIYNLPNALRDAANADGSNDVYYTGMCGKWHLNGGDGGLRCNSLNYGSDAELYEACLDVVKSQGWDWADAIFEGNIDSDPDLDYSHNPEWMVSQAQKFIDIALDVEQKPFFLHFATTLAHTPDSLDALESYTYRQTPKGELSGADVPDDTSMPTRTQIVERAELAPGSQDDIYEYIWLDSTLASLIDYLEVKGVYNNTFFVFMNDHGMFSKSVLYEGGTRMLMMVRYPPLFGVDGPYIMPSNMIVSNVDLAATVFALTAVEPSEDYVLDGVSWLDDVVDVIADPTHANTCCQLRFMNMVHSHAIVTYAYNYIYRMTNETDTDYSQLYPSFYETEQLYDVLQDPWQQNNVVDTYPHERKLREMERAMYYYIEDICPVDSCPAPMRFSFPNP